MEKEAVEDMRDLLRQSSGGADFRIVTRQEADTCRHRIFIGDTQESRNYLKCKKLENEERVYATVGEDIVIVGGGPCGTAYAVYQFLMDTVGFRALHFWGDIILPRHERLELPPLAYDREPAYVNRELNEYAWLLSGCPTAPLAFRRMMMHGPGHYPIRCVTGCHSLNAFIPSGQTLPGRSGPYPPFRDRAYFKSNPDFFGMAADGTRTPNLQLCFSNPDLRRELTNNIVEFIHFKGLDDTHCMIDLGAEDCSGKFCHCPKCADFEQKYGCGGGAFFDYIINEASPYFKTHFPKMKMRVLSYGGRDQTKYPPPPQLLSDGRLPANVVPFLALGTDYSKPMRAPSNADDYRTLQEWGAISREMFLYYYFSTFARPLVSIHLFGNVLRTTQDYRDAAKQNVRYAYNDFQPIFFQLDSGFHCLQYYLMTRLSNEPELDVDNLVTEYTDAIYGAAGQRMRDYFYELEQLGAAETEILVWNPDPRTATYLTPENLVRWQSAYDEMETLVADNANALAHLRCSRINLDLMTMLLWQEIQASGVPNQLDSEAIYSRFTKAANYALDKAFQFLPSGAAFAKDNAASNPVQRELVLGTGRFFHNIAAGGKPLPPAFDAVPLTDIRQVVPVANKELIPEEPEGAFGVALFGESPDGRATYTIVCPAPAIVGQADGEETLPRQQRQFTLVEGGPYTFHYIGRSRLTHAAVVTAPAPAYRMKPHIGGMGGYACAYVGHLFDNSDPNCEWDFYVSNRLKGDKVLTDRIVLVRVRDNRSPLFVEEDKSASLKTGD